MQQIKQELTCEERLNIINNLSEAMKLLIKILEKRQEERLKRLEDRILDELTEPISYDTSYDLPQEYLTFASTYNYGVGVYNK